MEEKQLPALPLGDDPWGLRTSAQTVRESVGRVMEWLGLVCKPAAEELGLLFKDTVHGWRARNAVNVIIKAEKKLREAGLDPRSVSAPPRLVYRACDEASWEDHDEVQELWAGLLASSCSPDGQDDSNLIFVNYLKEITSSQARLLSHIGLHSEKRASEFSLVLAMDLTLTLDEIKRIMGVDDLQRIDREIDHLAHSGLIGVLGADVVPGINWGGMMHDPTFDPLQNIRVTPSALALNLYVRAQGSRKAVIDYFNVPVGSLEPLMAPRPGAAQKPPIGVDAGPVPAALPPPPVA